MTRALVVAPHPDDEVLGCGGTIARLTKEGVEVHVAIVTKGFPPEFDATEVDAGIAQTREADAILGVAETHFLDFPAAGLDQVPHSALNASLGELVAALRPTLVLLPFSGDLHLDHQRVFLSGLVATRPSTGHSPARVLSYETLSETNWNFSSAATRFSPNVFVDISDVLEVKIESLSCFRKELREAPHERSIAGARSLAAFRGGNAGVDAAEAFVLIRDVQGSGRPLV